MKAKLPPEKLAEQHLKMRAEIVVLRELIFDVIVQTGKMELDQLRAHYTLLVKAHLQSELSALDWDWDADLDGLLNCSSDEPDQ